MLRWRDVGALFLLVTLWRKAYKDPTESISANAHLSFYVPISSTTDQEEHFTLVAVPAALDIDGDGKAEALATLVQQQGGDNHGWQVQILDLKPATKHDVTHLAPFAPKILYQSEPLNFSQENVRPMMITTGHVLHVPKTQTDGASSSLLPHGIDYEQVNEQTKHYFCGTDWHDASTKCNTPCPGGQVSECPDGERCFADTPCDIYNIKVSEERVMLEGEDDVHTTMRGGLPSLFCLFDNGHVARYTLKGKKDGDGTKRHKKALLELQLEWNVPAFEHRRPTAWESTALIFVDAVDASNEHGLLLLKSYVDYLPHNDTLEAHTASVVIALSPQTGHVIWNSLAEEEEQERLAAIPLPVEARGTTSLARRRSRNPSVHTHAKTHAATVDCLQFYRRSLLLSPALPHLHWSEDDARVLVAHLDHQRQHQLISHGRRKVPYKNRGRRYHHHERVKLVPKHGRPNVVISSDQLGLQVRSLKNGRSVCHVSLWAETLYADVNRDGVLDSIQVTTGEFEAMDLQEVNEEERWMADLVHRVAKMKLDKARADVQVHGKLQQTTPLCHVQVLSGIPQREELFNMNICGPDWDPSRDGTVHAAPPLAVEGTHGNDIIVAVSNGMVHRIRGKTGRRMWQIFGKHHTDFPTWTEHALLRRIDADNVIAASRPLLLAGENSLAIISAHGGEVLSTALFPQPVTRPPVLVDFDGDGTTDVLIVTADAVWGYQIIVNTGASIGFRILVGMLFFGLLLALLRNRFGPHPGKRSTDA